MKTPEENSKFMIWEWQQLPNLESLLLRARCVFVPLVLWNVCSRRKNGRKSILVTDGAPCCPKPTCENNLGHEACNHSKGIFASRRRKHGVHYFAHWWYRWNAEKSKGAVSSSWSTRKNGTVNPQLLQGIGIWQWWWHHGNSKGLITWVSPIPPSGYGRSKKKQPSSQGHQTL